MENKMVQLLLTLTLVLFTACAKKGYNSGGPCDQGVINDYNAMAQSCSGYNDDAACESAVNSFLSKYPGINCRAENKRFGFEVSLTEENIRSDFL